MKKLIPLLFVLAACGEPVEETTIPQLEVKEMGLNFEDFTVRNFDLYSLNVAQSGDYTVEVTDLLGELKTKTILSAEQGQNNYKIYTKTFQTGEYILKLYDSNRTLIQTKKLLIL